MNVGNNSNSRNSAGGLPRGHTPAGGAFAAPSPGPHGAPDTIPRAQVVGGSISTTPAPGRAQMGGGSAVVASPVPFQELPKVGHQPPHQQHQQGMNVDQMPPPPSIEGGLQGFLSRLPVFRSSLMKHDDWYSGSAAVAASLAEKERQGAISDTSSETSADSVPQRNVGSAVVREDNEDEGKQVRKIVTVHLDMADLLNVCPETAVSLLGEKDLGPEDFFDRVLKTELQSLAIHWHQQFHVRNGLVSAEARATQRQQQTEAQAKKIKGFKRDMKLLGKQKVSIRPTHCPSFLKVHRLLPRHRDRLVLISGTVVRMMAKRLMPVTIIYQCSCQERVEVDVSEEAMEFGGVRPTRKAPACPNVKTCGGAMAPSDTVFMDFSECRVQQKSEAGHLPRGITVVLVDELCGQVSVGHSIEVVGVVQCRWKGLGHGSVPQADLILKALNAYREDVVITSTSGNARQGTAATQALTGGAPQVQFTIQHFIEQARTDAERYLTCQDGGYDDTGNPIPLEEFADMRQQSPLWHNPMRFNSLGEAEKTDYVRYGIMRAKLLKSICPQLSGYFGHKLGVLAAAIGGVPRVDENGMKIRGMSHILFVGDPATGKSQLLRFAADLAPRSVCTAGMTSTTAGLTVAAVKEYGEWTLEPGALVLSDGGVCAIDELRMVAEQDRKALHEAMEQQTISVAKAGLMAQLKTETSIVAACNPPERRHNSARSLQVDTGVGGPLLSRFDLIFFMWDDRKMDTLVADHILQLNSDPHTNPPPISLMDLKGTYMPHIRSLYPETVSDAKSGLDEHQEDDGMAAAAEVELGRPLLDEDASEILRKYYTRQRSSASGSALSDQVPITVRFLEGLIRFAQALTKMIFKDECGRYEALMTVLLMERTAYSKKSRVGLGWEDFGFSCRPDDAGVFYDFDVHTTSYELDNVFLDDSAEGAHYQMLVLDRIYDSMFPEHLNKPHPQQAAVGAEGGSSDGSQRGKRSREQTQYVTAEESDVNTPAGADRMGSYDHVVRDNRPSQR